ncbi:hypothetical protein [Micromonospora avicenniae]|uniref:Uncharacterized protein n=1 Tax=Micromonospora avicenniae TaxID=1198245 RepID=A0A1N7EQK1_9ACTN|nr:hypothetical protein [Micromonospora avicenniae]SIR90336.1 hypothetical protein SAMN05444858_12622 [Micromonospora avicenniae]
MISRVSALWMLMWPAGLHHDWKLLHRKLTRVLVPRLSTDNPDMVSAGRKLVDAIGDLHDLVDELLRQDNAFDLPVPPEEDDPTASDQTSGPEPDDDGWTIWIADGEPEQRMRNLDDLASAFVTARQVVERGDRLMALLLAADPRRYRMAFLVRPARLDGPRRTAFDEIEESWVPPQPRSEQVAPAVAADTG